MADSEDDESLAGLTQNTFLKAPLEPCFDLFSLGTRLPVQWIIGGRL